MAKRWEVSFRADNERTEAREGAGDRDCVRGELCASASREMQADGTWLRVPARTYQPVCRTDRSILADCMLDAPATYRRLAGFIGVHIVAESVARTPFGPSIPLRVDIDLLMRGLVDACMSWLERVSAIATLSCPPTEVWRARSLNGHAASLLDESAPVISAHVDTMLSLCAEPMTRPSSSPAARICEALATKGDVTLMMADGATAALEFLALDHAARSALLETPAPVAHMPWVPCRSCDRRALRLAPPKQHDADPDLYSVCTFCRDAMDTPTYRAWVRAWAAYYDNRVTPAQVAAAV